MFASRLFSDRPKSRHPSLYRALRLANQAAQTYNRAALHNLVPTLIKHFEFWNPRLFELPYYSAIGFHCLINRIGPRNLPRANYALDHGDIGIGSKFDNQMQFDQRYFLPTRLLAGTDSTETKKAQIQAFAKRHGFPLIVKSNVGCVGKGVAKLSSTEDIETKTPLLLGDFLLQQFTPYPFEAGVFYIRSNGQPKISGINFKHFPSVVGNGVDNLAALARKHPRHSKHWPAFLQELDLNDVPAKGEERRLSFIGSHTLGCKFTDDTHRLTPELEHAIFSLFDSQPGYNFGRVDVKAENQDAFLRGEFVVIEVNGVASLPTHMFDPKNSVWQAYQIFLHHGKLLVEIAKQHRHQTMNLLPYREVIARVRANQRLLNQVHQRLMEGGSD